MTSLNKRNKARNTKLYNGAEKIKIDKLKYIYYFTKARRNKLKSDARKQYLEDTGFTGVEYAEEMENI